MKDCAVCVAIARVPTDADCGHDPAFTNLHLQLEPGEVVLDHEPDLQRVIAEVSDGRLRIRRDHYSLPDSRYPDGVWRHDHDWGCTLSTGATQGLAAMLDARESKPPDGAVTRARALLAGLDGTLGRQEIADLESGLTAVTEQLDVYRSRCQQLATENAELEQRLNAAYESALAQGDRVADLSDSLRSLIARIRSVGGYATPEEQDVLTEAERVCGGG